MTTPAYRTATLYADWNDNTYQGEVIDGETWNGWAIPRFTRTVAETIVADQQELWNAYNEDTAWMQFEGDSIRVIHADDPANDFIFADEDGMYSIGAMEWTWTEVPA